MAQMGSPGSGSLVLAMLLTGCWCPPLSQDDLEYCEAHWDVDEFDGGEAAWDGVILDAELQACSEEAEVRAMPWVEDEEGRAVQLDPTGECPRWAPEDGFEPGEYLWRGLRDVSVAGLRWDLEPTPLPFTIGAWGRDPDFEPAAVIGRSYLLDPGWCDSCTHRAGMDLATEFIAGPNYLEVHAADSSSAEVRLVMFPEDGEGACVYMAVEANLTASGELSWSTDRVTMSSDPPMEMRDLVLHAGFDSSGEEIRGFELAALVDLRGIEESDSFDRWQDACDFTAAFALPCSACEDGVEACLDLELVRCEGYLVEREIEAELPPCFIYADMPDWGWDTGWTPPDCDFSCATSEPRAFAAGLWGLLVFVAVRRRKGAV